MKRLPSILNFRLQRGVSLVELMVAMTIGLILIGTLTYTFAGTRNAFRAQEAQARKFENGRIALEMITRDLREASRMGCKRGHGDPIFAAKVKLTVDFPFLGFADEAAMQGAGYLIPAPPGNADARGVRKRTLNANRFINAYESGAGFSAPGATYTPISSTDVLEILKVGGNGAHLAEPLDPSATIGPRLQNVIPSAKPGGSKQPFVIGDCVDTEIVFADINTASGFPGGRFSYDATTAGETITKAYSPLSVVSRFEPVRYLVATPSTSSSVRTPFLVRYSLRPNGSWQVDPDIVADGIENLQIRFGASAGFGRKVVEQYVNADAVSDWNEVYSAEVSFDAISKEDNVGGAELAGDRRFRQRFSSVVMLRNRQPK